MGKRYDHSVPGERRQFLQTLGVASLVGAAGCADLLDDDAGDTDGETAVFEVTDVVVTDERVVQGAPFAVNAMIENTGDAEGEQDIELRIEDDSAATRSLTLAPGDTETIDYEVNTSELDPDRYTYGVYTEDADATGTVSVLWDIPDDRRPPSVTPGAGALDGDAPSDATYLWNGDDATLADWEEVSMGPSNRVAQREDSTTEEWGDVDTGEPQWAELEDETGPYLKVDESAGDIRTTDHFGDCQFHMEYRMEPDATGSGESLNNSGLFFLGHYELQVLDNYENESNANAMHGSFYGQHAPLVNSARDPSLEEWQTYDVLWRSPRWEDGDLVRPAQATVAINGVVKLAHVNGVGPTGGGGGDYSEDHPPEGPIVLQSHTDEPEFRNVWVRELPEKPIEDESLGDLPTYDTSAGEEFPEHVDPGGFGTSGEPPADANTLLDGDGLDQWESVTGGDPEWEVDEDYVEVEPGTGDIRTRAEVSDCQLHLEWRVPDDVEDVGLNRGNSGILMMGEYRFQILDNADNPTPPETWVGSYVDQAAPLASPIRAPGEWQHLDIVWQGPHFDGDALAAPAQATVFLNGVVVQTRLVLEGPNEAGEIQEYEPHGREAPLRLQDAGSRVQFRNAWYRDLQ